MSGLLTRPFLPALMLVLLTGCATTRPRECASPCLQCVGSERILFVADGAGDYGVTTANVRQVAREQRLPWCVEQVRWSHGKLRIYRDQTDHANLRAAGHCLAEHVRAYQAANPQARVSFLAHSAGSAVVLAALEELPPGSVDHVALLTPSVSVEYDLRCALRAVRCKMDVYYSERDWVVLGLATGVVGTADRRWTGAAGRYGFQPTVSNADDASLFAKLRQHPWDESMCWTGNHGGHFDPHVPEFLRYYVLPRMND